MSRGGVRRAVAACAAVLALAWGGAAAAARPAPSAPQDVHGLPSAGLAVRVLSYDAAKQGVLLLAEDGRQLAWLPGASIPLGDATLDSPGELLARAQGEEPVIAGRGGALWRVAGGRLVRVNPGRVELAGGAVLRVGPVGGKLRAEVRDRAGSLLATSAYPNAFRIAIGRLLVSGGAVTDLRTGHRWAKPAGFAWDPGGPDTRGRCAPAALRGERILALCSPAGSDTQDRGAPPFLALIARDGATEPLGVTVDWPWWVGGVAVSPDGRRVAVELTPPCGVPQTVVLGEQAGSRGALVTGEGGSPRRDGLRQGAMLAGWSRDGRVLAFVVGTGCEGARGSGLYAIDPATLQRTLLWRGSGFARRWAP